ncbi:SNF2 family N-terminal domain-containing protein [Russula earlei]|uniref:SNF2 family N-terminal domain-containing protein n=1 Tax=Russula earlei TaxID=71964 RepID=A0ACC0UL71_9AGAM|nr:SNF2 family N-terminal domain-containing protein [Russula earlei]
MATANLPHHNHVQLNQQQRQQNPAYAKERVQAIFNRANLLRSQGFTAENNQELHNLLRFISNFQNQQAQQSEHSNSDPSLAVNGHPSLPQQAQPTLNGTTISPQSSLGAGSFPTNPPHPGPSTTPISFTPEQINVLRAQIHAFKTLQRGLPVSAELQNIIRPPQSNNPELERLLSAQLVAKVADNAVKVQKASSEVPSTPAVPETPATPANQDNAVKLEGTSQLDDVSKVVAQDVDPDAPLYPYNAYVHPFTHLKVVGTSPEAYATRLQRLLVPSIMPLGLDPHQLINERRRFVEARIQQRIHELEAMSSTIGDGGLEPVIDHESKENAIKVENGASLKAVTLDLVHPPTTAHGKLRAVIELRSLRVLDKQRALRAIVAERLTHGSLLPLNRLDFRRVRKPAIRDTHMTENLERKQRVDRERRAKQKHVEQLSIICAHGREVLVMNRSAQDRAIRFGKSVLSFHAHAEREEQKRIERISKERLKALKADDEEAYMKLIDTAKDTRITHLLKQTDTYLDSLAQAVLAQQSENHLEVTEEVTSEETFGAQKSFDDPQEDKGKIDYYAVAHRIKEKVSKQPSLLVGGTLKDYQVKGLQWMVSLYNNRLNGILADEMGLGKTIQTISLVSFLIEVKKQRGPYLVVVPLSTMTNWSGEFAKWAPAVKVVSYKGNPMQRRALQTELRVNQFQVLLTTYEYIIKDRPILSKMKWVHMIIDEGHRMKNTQSKLAQTLSTYYHSRYRLILTGTPLQNNLPELWSLLNFVLPKIFNSVKSFDEWFNTPFANSGTPDKIELNEEEALLIIRRLHKVLRPFLLRRLKKDVEAELPDKVEKVVKVKMSALQAQLYKQMKKYKMIADGNDKPGRTVGVKGLSNELMQLRKICQHPFLFESVEDKINPAGLIDDKLVRTSGKIELLSRILPKFFATGHRVLIFFQMTKVMDIMEDFLKMMGFKYLRLDGGTKTEERAGHVQLFNAKDSDIAVFILSTRAGGLGLNLQTADTVIIFDSDWNPHADLQAQDRAHRIGQTKSVRILRFITEKSVEEAMYARARYKLDIDDKVIQAGRFDNKSTQEEQEEFLRSILEADQEEENEEAGDMNDEEINEIIARSDEEARLFSEMDMQRERDAVTSWKAAGNRGKPPLPLVTLEELPECYRTDEPFEAKDDIEEAEGRGHRRRAVINYNDGLSDDQWAMALEEGEDIQQLSEQARLKQARRAAKLESGTGTPVSEGGRGRGRKGKAKVNEVDFEPMNGKRKRGMNKSMSVTPSVMDDEEEDRDMKRRKLKTVELPTAAKERMKKAFNECTKAIMNCTDENGRKRCDLFRELPDKREYPDYYRIIPMPIALSHIRKRINTHQYKTVTAFRDDVRLMFTNARTYNQEGSWVYVDAVEMEKVFDAAYARHVANSGLPGAGYVTALTPMDEDREEGRPPPKSKTGRKQIVSDDEYLTPSDDE